MYSTRIIPILLIVNLLVQESFQGPDEDRVIDLILNKSGYNKLSRPVSQEDENLEVKFGISLRKIIDLNEREQTLRSSLSLTSNWQDYRLAWNASDYGGVRSIRLPASMIWTPDLLMLNSIAKDIDQTGIVVYSDGLCNWTPIGIYASSCMIDIEWFPFDRQVCRFTFGSWTYSGDKINLTLQSDVVDLSSYQLSGEWSLIDCPAKRNIIYYACCEEPYIEIDFNIKIQRRSFYFVFNLILPCVMISILSLATFCLPPDAGEKILLNIAVLLSLLFFSFTVSSVIPATSLAVSLIGMYFTCLMCMCTVSVIMTVIVLKFHHRPNDTGSLPSWMQVFVCQWIAALLCMRKCAKGKKSEQNIPSKSEYQNEAEIVLPMIAQENAELDKDPVSSSSDSKEMLSKLLKEVECITNKIEEDVGASEKIKEWRFAAAVIDRLMFCVFTLYMIITSLAVFCRLAFYVY